FRSKSSPSWNSKTGWSWRVVATATAPVRARKLSRRSPLILPCGVGGTLPAPQADPEPTRLRAIRVSPRTASADGINLYAAETPLQPGHHNLPLRQRLEAGDGDVRDTDAERGATQVRPPGLPPKPPGILRRLDQQGGGHRELQPTESRQVHAGKAR